MIKKTIYSYYPKENGFSEGFYQQKKSKFYSYIYKVESIEEINDILEKIKKQNKKAKHVVYAYILETTAKYTDDSEPSGTAGKAIYSIMIKEKIVGNLVIVARYFGGTLLGIGPLSRAYTKAFKDAAKKCDKICCILK